MILGSKIFRPYLERQGQSQFIQQMISNGKSAKEIADFVGIDIEAINKMIKHSN